jgi:hypothetical protein
MGADWAEPLTRGQSSRIGVENGAFDVILALVEAPITTLIAFVSIQTSAGMPGSVLEMPFFDGHQPDTRRFVIPWCEGNTESFACAQKKDPRCSR